MGLEFRLDSPVLDYGPRAHVRFGPRRWLLWPVYAYRVLAPQVRDRQVNVFEKAILGLCAANESDPDEIAALLHLDRDLVVLILEELDTRKLLRPDRTLTPLGRDVLAEECEETPRDLAVTVGYVFQDPWSGVLWPRFVPELRYSQTRISNGYLVLRRGPQGKEHPVWPFVKRMSAPTLPTPPTATDILTAVRQHRKTLRQPNFVSFDEDDDGSGLSSTHASTIDRVSIVADEPEPCYLATYLYVPAEDTDTQDWHVADPFGFGSSPRLRLAVESQMGNDEYLHGVVCKLLGKASTSEKQLQNDLSSIHDLAVQELGTRLGSWVSSMPFYLRLVAMEREHKEIGLLRDCPHDKLENLAVKIGKALESVFGAIQDAHPATDAYLPFRTPDKQYREELLNAIAGDLGFETPLPNSIIRARPDGVRRACDLGGGTLAQRAVVALLVARKDSRHPLRLAASRLPDLFSRLDTILRLRDQSAHDSKLVLNAEQTDVEVGYCYDIIQALCTENQGGQLVQRAA